MKNIIAHPILAGGLLAAAAALSACGSDVAAPRADDDPAATAQVPLPAVEPPGGTGLPQGDPRVEPARLAVSSTTPLYLVDASGAALYFLAEPASGQACDSVCEDAWPPVLANDAEAAAGEGVDAGMVGSTRRPDGAHHVTYAGHALYRYAGDAGAGRNSGHGVSDRWGQWSLITPHGERVQERPSAMP